jgi:hypothetical protein
MADEAETVEPKNSAVLFITKTCFDIVRDIGTFWKTNKAHIWIPNIKQGFFGITRPTEAEMAKYR